MVIYLVQFYETLEGEGGVLAWHTNSAFYSKGQAEAHALKVIEEIPFWVYIQSCHMPTTWHTNCVLPYSCPWFGINPWEETSSATTIISTAI